MPTSHSDDIPEALRDSAPTRSSALSSIQTSFPLLWLGLIGVGAIALGAATALLWQPVLTYFSGSNPASLETTENGDEPAIAANDPSSTDGSSQGTEDETGETGEPIDATASNPDSLTDELL
ncbi:MAG: hypothetical protein F6K30_18270, partial [Cyanothece sp. SIO2G6]|nr:hypothetical protein [Cyanothece sp. SIO2G6]